MPLTRDFKETVMARMKRSSGFRAAMLREGVDVLLNGELEIGKEVLRDYINATMGFDALSKQVDIPPKSLMRMLGPAGNPQMKNLFAVIAALQRHAGIELHIAVPKAEKKKPSKRASKPSRIPSVVYPKAEAAAHGSFREARGRFTRP